ncbi:hypothetical protein FKM82_025098 [Ascaphus truei]
MPHTKRSEVAAQNWKSLKRNFTSSLRSWTSLISLVYNHNMDIKVHQKELHNLNLEMSHTRRLGISNQKCVNGRMTTRRP